MKSFPDQKGGFEGLIMIETQRLILRPVDESDFDIFRRLLSCPHTTRYLPGGEPYQDKAIQAHHANRIKHWERGYGTFVILSKISPHMKLGYVGIEASPKPVFSDIRYALDSDYSGQGYGLEAAKACLDFTFQLGLHDRIYGVALRQNTPSIRILRQLGMTYDGSVALYDGDDLLTLSKLNPTKKEKGFII